MKNKLVLVGYRATGKSTLARALAKRSTIDWIDLDVAIEERAGTSISTIFAEKGETYFRDLEEQVVADTLRSDKPLVIATGGGAPLRESSRKLMKEYGEVVWLTASVETIARRMSGDSTTGSRRPSLTDAKSPVEEIKSVLTVREPIYRAAATLIVDTEGKSIDELVAEIASSVPDFFS